MACWTHVCPRRRWELGPLRHVTFMVGAVQVHAIPTKGKIYVRLDNISNRAICGDSAGSCAAFTIFPALPINVFLWTRRLHIASHHSEPCWKGFDVVAFDIACFVIDHDFIGLERRAIFCVDDSWNPISGAICSSARAS